MEVELGDMAGVGDTPPGAGHLGMVGKLHQSLEAFRPLDRELSMQRKTRSLVIILLWWGKQLPIVGNLGRWPF